jgi:hypothetical protein
MLELQKETPPTASIEAEAMKLICPQGWAYFGRCILPLDLALLLSHHPCEAKLCATIGPLHVLSRAGSLV